MQFAAFVKAEFEEAGPQVYAGRHRCVNSCVRARVLCCDSLLS